MAEQISEDRINRYPQLIELEEDYKSFPGISEGQDTDRRRFLQIIGYCAAVIASSALLDACKGESSSPDAPGIDKKQDTLASQGFNIMPPHNGLENSDDPRLRTLAKYESKLDRGFPEMMLFGDMPVSQAQAEADANNIVLTLKEFARFGIRPHMVFEPQGIDLRSVDRKFFDAYFKTIKTAGVTDEEMGIWSLFPEPNIPEWGIADDKGNTNPELFIKNFTIVADTLRTHFPKAMLAVLLDSQTTPSYDTAYARSSYKSLLPYVIGLPKVDRFILQALPWAERANEGSYTRYNPAEFLPARLAIEAAGKLGVKNVMFNSGTFRIKYKEPNSQIVTSPGQRTQILNGVLAEAKKLQNRGLAVSINVFAENKITVDEETDFSYPNGPHWNAFSMFVQAALGQKVGLAIFDAS